MACLQEILKQRGWEGDYPLFTTVNRIVSGYFPPADIVNFKEVRVHSVNCWCVSLHEVRCGGADCSGHYLGLAARAERQADA
jgi:hypothetical protein